jgi:hypothetical protein
MVEVRATDVFDGWYGALTGGDRKSIDMVVGLLREHGVLLGAPYSSALQGSDFAFRELRPKRGASPLRVIYAFSPSRNALLILGGDKSGDNRFYRRAIAQAEQIWTAYLAKEQP